MNLKIYSPDAHLVNKQLREFFSGVDVTSIYVTSRHYSIHKVRKKDSSCFHPAALFQFMQKFGYGVEIF